MSRAIDTDIQNIRNAVYGEEVRGSIVDALEQCYDDAVDVVKVSETQPTEENTKIWIKPTEEEYKVPTWAEHEELAGQVSDLNRALDDNGLATLIVDGWIAGKRWYTPDPGTAGGEGALAAARYVKVPCVAGDVFVVNATAYSAYRPWAFYDSNDLLLSRASNSGPCVNEVITAPANASYVAINQDGNQGRCYIGNYIENIIDKTETTTQNLVSEQFRYNSYDALEYTNLQNKTSQGVTFTNNGDGTITVSTNGSPSTGDAFDNFITHSQNNVDLPEYITRGRRYVIKPGGSIPIAVYLYRSATDYDTVRFDDDGYLDVPSDIIGMIVRLFVPSGTTVTETIHPKMIAVTGDTNGSHITYENEYNISVSPIIETDDNGWLAPVDTDTADESGKTDMTAAIMAMLTQTGYCHLAPGIYYVSGNIDMPDGSMIEGCGYKTIIRLLASQNSGYIIKPTRFCTVSNLRLQGARTTVGGFGETIGTRHGLYFVANYDGSDSGSQYSVNNCRADNLWIEHFSGSGINCRNTSNATNRGIYITQSYILDCHTGININHYSEFNKFVNICTRDCYYGIYNGGGNNVFTSCTIHATNTGFVVDGSQPNNAHGLCANSTFCHIGNNTGKAILVNGTESGYVFSCCQVHYCSIEVKNSYGIMFEGFQFGQGTGTDPEKPGGKITVSGGGLVAFVGCSFKGTPDINVTGKTKFDSCYDFVTGSAISA